MVKETLSFELRKSLNVCNKTLNDIFKSCNINTVNELHLQLQLMLDVYPATLKPSISHMVYKVCFIEVKILNSVLQK